MDDMICQRYLKGNCNYGSTCKYKHPNPLTDNIAKVSVVIMKKMIVTL